MANARRLQRAADRREHRVGIAGRITEARAVAADHRLRAHRRQGEIVVLQQLERAVGEIGRDALSGIRRDAERGVLDVAQRVAMRHLAVHDDVVAVFRQVPLARTDHVEGDVRKSVACDRDRRRIEQHRAHRHRVQAVGIRRRIGVAVEVGIDAVADVEHVAATGDVVRHRRRDQRDRIEVWRDPRQRAFHIARACRSRRGRRRRGRSAVPKDSAGAPARRTPRRRRSRTPPRRPPAAMPAASATASARSAGTSHPPAAVATDGAY